MGEKDMVEKIMEDYPDVFADILNVLLFDGKQVVQPEELFDVGLRSQFKADTGWEHEQERNVAKYWIRDGNVTVRSWRCSAWRTRRIWIVICP